MECRQTKTGGYLHFEVNKLMYSELFTLEYFPSFAPVHPDVPILPSLRHFKIS